MGEAARSLRHDAGYWALRWTLATSPLLGLRGWRAWGGTAARAAWRLAGTERRRVERHLELAFPDEPPAWRRATAQACGRHVGLLLGEVVWLWRAAPEAVLARTVFTGLEHLRGALDAAGGAILVTGHCGNWEWMNLALGAAGIPMSVAARAVYDARLDTLTHRLRGRFGGETVVRGVTAGRRLAAAVRRHRVVGLLIDQDIDAPGCFVDFFGRPAWTPTGAAVLALRARVPVVTGFAARRDDGVMQISFRAPEEPPPEEDVADAAAALTARCTARIEDAIRANPAQWVWMHRRWRRRPQPDDEVWSADGTRRAARPDADDVPVQS